MKTIEAKKKANNESFVYDSSALYATLRTFKNYLNYTEPLSYEEWLAVADDDKAAVLFVQFFDQISMVMYRLKTDAATMEDCVSEVILYLMKNVPNIVENKSRFKPGYIYRICYNCVYCKSVDPYNGQTASTSYYNNTTSQYKMCGDTELNLFDTVPDDVDMLEEVSRPKLQHKFWELLEDVDEPTQALIAKILGESIDINISRRIPRTEKRKQEILDNLRQLMIRNGITLDTF